MGLNGKPARNAHSTIREARRINLSILSLVATLFVAGCGADDDIGPCIHSVYSPVLTFHDARSRSTQTLIPKVMIDSVRFDGVLLDSLGLAGLTITNGEDSTSFNLVQIDNRLECTPPCGINGEPGLYTFYLSADGHKDEELTIEGDFQTKVGGCPSSWDDGKLVSVTLTPE